MRNRTLLILLVAFLALFAVLGCSLAGLGGSRAPTPTPTFTKTPKPTFSPTPVYTATPTSTNTPMFTPTPVPTDTPAVPPTPTDTPMPTPTPTPQAIVNIADLNYRAGPGVAYASLGRLPRGYQLEVRKRLADNSWLRVCCLNDQEGWVASQYVDLSMDINLIPVDETVPPTPTPRPRPPTNTPAPPPPPTNTPAPAFFYRAVVQACRPNAGITYIQGTVYHGSTPQKGITVRFSWQPDGAPVADYVTGTDPNRSVYTFILDPDKPRAGDWYVWVIDASGNRISEMAHVRTTASSTEAGACQEVIIDFVH